MLTNPWDSTAPGVRPYARGIVYPGFFIRLNNFPICFSDSQRNRTHRGYVRILGKTILLFNLYLTLCVK